MVTRELIKDKIDNIPDQYLEELFNYINELEEKAIPEKGILAKLQEIKFEGPPDLAKNIDLYMNGEKKFE